MCSMHWGSDELYYPLIYNSTVIIFNPSAIINPAKNVLAQWIAGLIDLGWIGFVYWLKPASLIHSSLIRFLSSATNYHSLKLHSVWFIQQQSFKLVSPLHFNSTEVKFQFMAALFQTKLKFVWNKAAMNQTSEWIMYEVWWSG